MKVKNMNEAWNKANEIFPTDYEQDNKSSERAGYPVYRSTADGHYYDYICDLGDRLEINLSTGETINIWVEDDTDEPSEEEIKQLIADHNAAVAAGERGWMNIDPQPAMIYNFCVMHTDYDDNKAEHDMAEALNRADEWQKAYLMIEYTSAWCKANNVNCGGIEIIGTANKFTHGNDRNYHFCFRALVTPRV